MAGLAGGADAGPAKTRLTPIKIQMGLTGAAHADRLLLRLIEHVGFYAISAGRQLREKPRSLRFRVENRLAAFVHDAHPNIGQIITTTLHRKQQAQVELTGQGIEFIAFAFANPSRDVPNALTLLNVYQTARRQPIGTAILP